MSRVRSIALTLVLLAALGLPDVSFADGSTHAGSHGNYFYVGASSASDGHHGAASQTSGAVESQGVWHEEVGCAVGGLATCADVMVCPDGSIMARWVLVAPGGAILDSYYTCPSGASTQASPVITNALVLRALRRVELPGSELGVQPPGGETLVNFETNFFTEAGEFTRTVRLLGRRVELRVWPSRFRWVFGDGVELASSGPGARYPDLEITHAYRVEGAVRASVETTYAARFRVDGGRWRDVVGTVTVAGEPVRLRVRTARPVLVSYR